METTCYNHPNVPATATCADCGAPICAACTRMLRGRPFCAADYTMAGREVEDVLLPIAVPYYRPEKKTQRMMPLRIAEHAEQTPLVQIEEHKLAPNFVYQHAADTSIQPQDTASMLLQTEEAQTPKTEGKPRKAWEDTMIWAVIGLVCALIVVLLINTTIDAFSSMIGGLSAAGLFSVISLLIVFWTILSRQDSSRPRYIIWIGLTSIIVLAIVWISAPFLIQEKQQYLDYLQHLRYPDLYK
jgi:B-box zinc finger